MTWRDTPMPLSSQQQADWFFDLLAQVRERGRHVSPRGQEVLEVTDCVYHVPPGLRFMTFAARKLSLPYLRTEFRWYLNGDPADLSICAHARIWQDLVSGDGTLNSNYGQYLFREGQFRRVVETLQADPDSRRGSIIILQPRHLLPGVKDVPCTYGLNFRIRNGALDMTVHMRSQDVIFGLGNDLPCFSFVHEMLLNALRRFFPALAWGSYTHVVDSLHAYARHYALLELLSDRSTARASFMPVDCPPMAGSVEVDELLRVAPSPASPYAFTRWLCT